MKTVNNIDYSLKNGDKVWFTFKTHPEEDSDWIEAEILDLNWAWSAAAIQLKGYKGVSCHGISGLKRKKYYFKSEANNQFCPICHINKLMGHTDSCVLRNSCYDIKAKSDN